MRFVLVNSSMCALRSADPGCLLVPEIDHGLPCLLTAVVECEHRIAAGFATALQFDHGIPPDPPGRALPVVGMGCLRFPEARTKGALDPGVFVGAFRIDGHGAQDTFPVDRSAIGSRSRSGSRLHGSGYQQGTGLDAALDGRRLLDPAWRSRRLARAQRDGQFHLLTQGHTQLPHWLGGLCGTDRAEKQKRRTRDAVHMFSPEETMRQSKLNFELVSPLYEVQLGRIHRLFPVFPDSEIQPRRLA